MTFAQWVNSIVSVGNTVVVPIIFALAFLTFLWGILQNFFFHGDSEEGRRTGRAFILWGVLGMVLLFSVWGVVNIIITTLGFSR